MDAGGQTWIHEMPDTAVLGWARMHPRHGRFYGLANVSVREAAVPVDVLRWAGIEQPRDVLGTGGLEVRDGMIHLHPLGYAWFVDDADGAVQPASPSGGRA